MEIIIDNRNKGLISEEFLKRITFINVLASLKNNNYITDASYKKSIVQIKKKHN